MGWNIFLLSELDQVAAGVFESRQGDGAHLRGPRAKDAAECLQAFEFLLDVVDAE